MSRRFSDGLDDRLTPLKVAYVGAACLNCMETNVSLLRCARCKRARYCNRQCQKHHYKRHQQECALLEMFRDNYSNFPAPPAEEFRERRLLLYSLRHAEIVRRLVTNGKLAPVPDMAIESTKCFLMWSRVCAHCKQNEYDLPVKGVCCPTCKFGWCCSQDHFDAYMQTGHHLDVCGEFVKSTSLELFRWKHVKEYNDRFTGVPHHHAPPNYDPPFALCPSNWDEYFKIRYPFAVDATQDGSLCEEFLQAATMELSQPGTCLYALFLHEMEHFTKKGRPFASQNLTIHIVGASGRYEVPPMGNVWEELMHCLPSVGSLRTVFIGPEVGINFGDDSPRRFCVANSECCPVCTAQGRKRSQEFFENTYHGYQQDEMFSQPDLIVAFNTGMYEECTESWKTSLDVMLDLDVPCLFTSYAKDEALGDYAVLESVEANCLSDKAVINPMRDVSPRIEPCPSLATFHINMYATGFKGRK